VDNIDAKLEMFARGYDTAPQLSRNIFERVRPLPAKMVRPLGKFDADDPGGLEFS
jgi:3'-5' exoribonuclease